MFRELLLILDFAEAVDMTEAELCWFLKDYRLIY